MNTSFRSIRDALLLFVWGAFVLWLHYKNLLPTYLHPALQPYTLAAGVILIILSLFSLRGLLTFAKSESGCCAHEHTCCSEDHASHHHDHEDHHHGHDHDRGVHLEHDHEELDCCTHGHQHGDEKTGLLIFKTIVLLMPLAVVLLGHDNHYTMSTITNRGIVQDISKIPAARSSAPVAAPAATTNAPATSSASMPIQVVDLLYAVQMPTYREDFEGKQVELIGQFVPLTVGNPKGNRFQAIRLFMTCCAADAKPVGVTVQYDKPLNLSEMGWIKITGVPTFPMEGGRRTAVLVASKVEECPAPSEPFVY